MSTPAIHCAFDELVRLEDLVPNPKNPNTHPKKQIKLLAKIFRENGVRRPITVSKRTGVMTVGHGRLEAARICGMEFYPVDYQDYDSDEHEMADMLADNRIPELAEMDLTLLEENKGMLEIAGFDLEIAGFDDKQPVVKGDEDTVRVPFGDDRDSIGIFELCERFDLITCMFSGGKDSIAVVLYLLEIGVPREKINLFCCLTPMDPPKFDEYISYCQDKIGIEISINSRVEIEEKFIDGLKRWGYPGRMINWCNTMFKVDPFKLQRKKLIDENGICMIGNRADESNKRSKQLPRGYWNKMPFAFPIFDWTNEDVRQILLRHEFKLHFQYKTDSRLNCMQCYNQGKSGWAALRRNFPDDYQKGLKFFGYALESSKFRNTEYCRELYSQITAPDCEAKDPETFEYEYYFE